MDREIKGGANALAQLRVSLPFTDCSKQADASGSEAS
jgi:hypothetical protein